MSTSPEFDLKDFIYDEQCNDWFDNNLSIYHCQFRKDVYSDTFFNTLGLRFPISLEKAVQKRKAEYLAGRYCASRSLQHLGVEQFDIGTGQHRAPIWPKNILGSISHCGNHAVAATSNLSVLFGIGIDIEDHVTAETMHRIKTQILCDEEMTIFCDVEHDNCLAFTLSFSVKESFFKAAYPIVQKYFDFYAITILSINHLTQKILFRINNTLHEKLAKGMIIEGEFKLLPEGKVVTLVILGR